MNGRKLLNKVLPVVMAFMLTFSSMVTTPVAYAAEEESQETSVFISEYVEGSSFNKAIELYNGTEQAVDLSNYAVELYSNGNTASTNAVTLEGTLEAGSVYVIAHQQADDAIKANTDLQSSVVNFNGDDAIVLKDNNQVIDSLGTVGERSEYGKDTTLVRKSTVMKGSPTFTIEEWDQQTKDYFENLGKHGDSTTDPTDPVEPPEVEPKTIAEIRNTSGEEVKTTGTVTAVFVKGGKANVYIQDESAGIIVRAENLDNKVNIGDEIQVQGITSQYYDMAQIAADTSNVEIVKANSGVPVPPVVTSDEMTEEVEGELVQLHDVTIDSTDEHGNHTAADANGTFVIYSDLVETGQSYDIVMGVVNFHYGEYKLQPRNKSDMVGDKTVVSEVNATPKAGLVQKGTKVELTTSTKDATIYYTTDGTEPSTSSQEYTQPIEVNEAITMKALAVKDGFTKSDVSTFTYEIGKDLNNVEIHDIQGTSHTSPYEGKTVQGVDGIVTHIDGSNVYMQEVNPDDNENTSEGILVYERNHGLQVGDFIVVDGEVKEYVLDGYSDRFDTDLTMTEIDASTIEVKAKDQSLPKPVVLGKNGRVIPDKIIDNDAFEQFDPKQDAIDFYESLEAMHVQIDQPTIVGPQKYGELPVVVHNGADQLVTEAGGYKLSEDDPNPEIMYVQVGNYTAKIGDFFNGSITGVMSYDYQNYKIYRDTNEVLPPKEDGAFTPEITTIDQEEEQLTVAAYNIQNFSATSESAKVNKLATSIANNLQSPDVIALQEVQDNNGDKNDGTTEADQSYQRLVDAIVAAGGPTYKYTDVAPVNNADGGKPGANIRVGYLYNPDRVTLKEAEKGTATEAVEYKNGDLSKNPGRIAPSTFTDTRKPLAAEFVFNEQEVIVVNAHFNSKFGDTPLFGKAQPPHLGSEAERLKLVTEVNKFVNNIQADNPKENIVVLGDMNDFEFSKPVQTLQGSELTNLAYTLPETERWTYNYRGNSQALDHILVSNNLADQAKLDIVHANAPFMEEHGRASDHDPLLAQIDLAHANNGDGEKTINILHTNDSHSRVYEGKYDGMGFAKLSTLIQQFEEENENTLLLDAGDTFHGKTFSTLVEGESIVEIMNTIGYDTMAAGNHDFNYGYERLLELNEMSHFPVLSANAIDDATGEPILDPYVIQEVDGVSFGIFGLTTPETHYKTHPKNVEGITFEDPTKVANEMVAELEKKNVDVIIALTHLGTDPSSTDTSLKVARGTEGIDVIVDGHSHTVDDMNESGTLIVSAGEYLKNLGVVELSFDENNDLIRREASRITKEQAADIKPDPAVEAVIEEIEASQEEELSEEIGETKVELNGEREHVRTGETNLGNLITDAMLAETGADVSLMNGGAIRASIDQGVMTKGEVITVLPFGNYIQTINVTGEDLKAALENGVKAYPETSGGFPHVGGMSFAIDPAKPVGERVHSINIAGEPMEIEAIYTLATNDFLVAGGDQYTSLTKYDVQGDFSALDESVITYIQQQKIIEPQEEGRIVEAPTPNDGGDGEDNKEKTNVIELSVINGKASITNKDLAQTNPNKDIILDLGVEKAADIELTAEQVALLKENNQAVQIVNDDVTVHIPASNLPAGKVTIQVKRLKDMKEAKSAVYDFTIIDENGEKVHVFDKPVTLTFHVNKGQIDDKKNVHMFYFNEQAGHWEVVPGSKLKGKKVVAKTSHLSTFTVFELDESDDPDNSDNKGEGNNDNQDNENGNKNDNPNGTESSDESEDIETLPAPSDDPYELPNTATSTFNILTIGVIALVLGGVLLVIRRRKLAK
ncbi:5'-nucleotidase C-terminal domain-containing protein [Pontibacillus litoralis]|uniref:LPXTG cell wall anchor domain-containing protein n=1 Tax=Pontibacillus litoralis JSM 072002 TaxID=1385512 RepID=A0A0A5HPN3_9BACI|nr:5'-nucleotidase C-terminal domain-containing protein [Pontibacillus litoralis]KGX85567.1 hypothetical protein N784_08645 [Pontibacillus litoralis JSM 072002]